MAKPGALSLVDPTADEAQDFGRQMSELTQGLIQTPEQQRKDELLAWGAGLGSNADGSGLGGALGRAMGAQSAYRLKDRELKAQYTPLIMNALAAQQQAQAAARFAQNFGSMTGGGSLKGVPFSYVTQMKVQKGIDLTEQWKLENQGTPMQAGTYREKADGTREFLPDVSKGLDVDEKGNVRVMPGFAAASGQIAGAQTEGQEAAKAGWAIEDAYDPETKQPIKVLKKNMVAGLGGAGASPAPTPAPGAGGTPGVATVGQPPAPRPAGTPGRPVVQAGEQSARDSDAKAVIQSELAKTQGQLPQLQAAVDQAPTPEARAKAQADLNRAQSDVAGLQRELGRMSPGVVTAGAAQPSAGGVKGIPSGPSQLNKTSAEALSEGNKYFMKTYEDTQNQGRAAGDQLNTISTARTALNKLGDSGWGAEAKSKAAAVLGSWGVKDAEDYATNAQMFQQAAKTKLWQVLGEQKGPQTEGDAQRAEATWASLTNTKQYNQFILDFSQALAERQKQKADFYAKALPLARENNQGDLMEVERRWQNVMKNKGSIFDEPSMKRWKK